MSAVPKTAGEGNDLGHRALRLIQTVQKKLEEFERPGLLSKADVLFGRLTAQLAELPLAELEATAAKLERHIAKCGCSVERCFGDDYALSDIVLQIRSTQEQAQPYLPYIPK